MFQLNKSLNKLTQLPNPDFNEILQECSTN